jgi:hypothetical protein
MVVEKKGGVVPWCGESGQETAWGGGDARGGNPMGRRSRRLQGIEIPYNTALVIGSLTRGSITRLGLCVSYVMTGVVP